MIIAHTESGRVPKIRISDVTVEGIVNDIEITPDLSETGYSYKKEKVVYYQIDLELTNLETNEVVWMGDKKIKKQVSDRAF